MMRIFRRKVRGVEVLGGPADGSRFTVLDGECTCMLYWHEGTLTNHQPFPGMPPQYELHEHGGEQHYCYCPDGVWSEEDAPDAM